MLLDSEAALQWHVPKTYLYCSTGVNESKTIFLQEKSPQHQDAEVHRQQYTSCLLSRQSS